MDRRKFMIGAAGSAAALTFGSLAYTEATVERDVNVSVVADDDAQAAIMFTSGPGTTIRSDGQLEINGVSGHNDAAYNESYVTPDGNFTFGNTTDPTTSGNFAFSMTNQLSESRDFDITVDTSTSDTDLLIELFDSTGTKLDEVNNSGSMAPQTLAAGESVYAVITINTGPGTETVNGTVTISAN